MVWMSDWKPSVSEISRLGEFFSSSSSQAIPKNEYHLPWQIFKEPVFIAHSARKYMFPSIEKKEKQEDVKLRVLVYLGIHVWH